MKALPMSKYPILIVDDEEEVLESFELILNSGGMTNVITCRDSRDVLGLIEEKGEVEVILLDLIMPYLKGQDILPILTENYPEIPIIVVTATDDLETAVACMKTGSFDYLVKPVEKMRLISSVRRAVEKRELARENSTLKKSVLSYKLDHPEAFATIITQSRAMLAIFQYMEAIASSPGPVLITGETGVGKELMARVLHSMSGLPGPLVSVNIAGLDDLHFSDTLFGHRKGAFTGADTKRDGLLKKTGAGTLFLDEIGDLSHESQIKLLRLLQEGEYFPIGSDLPQKSTARILAATNRDLTDGDHHHGLRRDLYYRLQIHQVHLPPLRQRMEDLPLLVDHFMEKASQKLGKTTPRYPDELVPLLSCYHFPGNIRELETMIFDSVSNHKSRTLSLDTFKTRVSDSRNPSRTQPGPTTGATIFSHLEILPTLTEVDHQLVREAIHRANDNQSIASRLLGISQPALSRRLKQLKEKQP
ncbi:MAG: sigma-54-dependent Fis family transcriptional regulator [Desulfobacterales bacterium]|nr:sigma-54-dependent Fis family transcriptional regulator [Desulfobacterales bacterium]